MRYINAKNVLDLPIRAQIMTLVQQHPGSNEGFLASMCPLSNTSTRYHLDILIATGNVAVEHDERNGRRYYYPINSSWLPEARRAHVASAAAFRSPLAKEIYAFIVKHPGISTSEIARALDQNTSSVTWHTQRLVKTGVLRHQITARRHRFWATDVSPEPEVAPPSNGNVPFSEPVQS